MRRYIVLLLITGIVWAQTDFYDYDLPYDEYFGELVLKDGTTYLGEYAKTEEEIVYFKPQNAFAFQPISIKKIKILQLKDGQFIIGSSSDILTYEENQKELIIIEDGKKSLTLEEKAIYDANLYNLNKWALYMPMSTILFVGCVVSHMGLTNDLSTPSPFILGSSLAASLTIPYFVLNINGCTGVPTSSC